MDNNCELKIAELRLYIIEQIDKYKSLWKRDIKEGREIYKVMDKEAVRLLNEIRKILDK